MTDVFDQNTNKETVAPVVVNTVNDKLKSIVNENGQPKYQSVEAALDSLLHSQDHIRNLEAENKIRDEEILRLREVESRAKTLDDIVQKLQTNNNPQTDRQTPTPSSGMSEKATIEALERIIAERDARTTSQANLKKVNDILVAKFGDAEKAKAAVIAKAAELGISVAELGTLSGKSPSLVLTHFGEKVETINPVTPSQISLPSVPRPDAPIERPKQSLLSGVGATDKNRRALMDEIKKRVYERLEVKTE